MAIRDYKGLASGRRAKRDAASTAVNKNHWPTDVFWDNIGQGWRIECACRFSELSANLQDAGQSFDDHVADQLAAALAKAVKPQLLSKPTKKRKPHGR